MVCILYLLFFVGILTEPVNARDITSLKELVYQSVPVREDGKIDIPPHIKHIKLDIGLSYAAPMSQYWLTHEDNLLVFGFEPNPDSVHSILEGAVKKHPAHGDPLETRFVGKSFFLIPCALGLSTKSSVPFFITQQDEGCSSLYIPISLEVKSIINVPIFSLADFFDVFPFDSHPIIDYIKIDAQGADLEIAKSAKHYLTERVIYITLEAENSEYKNTVNSFEAIDSYMKSIGFVRHMSSQTSDPTYFNPRFSSYINSNDVQIYQKG